MSKITIGLSGKDYDIKLEGEFAKKFEQVFKEQFGGKSNLDAKDVLFAYVGKCYENFQLEQEIKELLNKIEEI